VVKQQKKEASGGDFEHCGLGWNYISDNACRMQFAGAVTGVSAKKLLRLLNEVKPDLGKIKTLINGFSGHFGILYQDNSKIIAATDCIASYPIFYKKSDNDYLIATAGSALVRNGEIDKAQGKALMLSGYTVGNKTIYADVLTFQHGQIYFQASGQTPQFSRYYRYTPWADPLESDRGQLKRNMVAVTLSAMLRVIEQAAGQTIAVPLSAGLDSRLVASSLKHLGAENVVCYSYGPKGNFESRIAKQIADRLGYKWVFIEVTPDIQKKFWDTQIPKRFAAASNDFLAGPVFHDLFVTQVLLNQGLITKESIVVNGNSGDFISGNHIPLALAESGEIYSSENADKLIEILIKKHFSMWTNLVISSNTDPIRKLLRDELFLVDKLDDTKSPKSLSAIHEYLEMTNRQIKWVIKRQKIYDYFSIGWALPLWDKDLMIFWETVPLKYKRKQNLYIEMLYEENWGGVWQDIPGNSARYVSPAWLRYLVRPFLKAMHLPLGKVAWHKCEKRVLDYWLDELGFYGPFGYKSVLFEKDLARNSLAFHIREYGLEMGCELDTETSTTDT
jgi:asparagine synthase (glutamine-hydrolysing)